MLVGNLTYIFSPDHIILGKRKSPIGDFLLRQDGSTKDRQRNNASD